MADISKCKGEDCSIRDSCYRFTASSNIYRQSYIKGIEIDGYCKDFYENRNNKINKSKAI